MYILPRLSKLLYVYFSEGEGKKKDFPGGPLVNNLPSNERNVGSIPNQGTKIPHAAGQLSLCTVTTEPTLSRACTPQLERVTPQLERHTPQLERRIPQLERRIPQLERLTPQLERLTPQLERLTPQPERLTPQLERLMPQ